MTTTYMKASVSPRYNTVYNVTGITAAPNPVQVTSDPYDLNAATIVIDVTAAATSNVSFNFQGFDPVSGKAYALGTGAGLTSGTISAVSTTVLRIHANIPNSATLAQDMVPNQLLVTPTHSGVGAFSYTVTILWDL